MRHTIPYFANEMTARRIFYCGIQFLECSECTCGRALHIKRYHLCGYVRKITVSCIHEQAKIVEIEETDPWETLPEGRHPWDEGARVELNLTGKI